LKEVEEPPSLPPSSRGLGTTVVKESFGGQRELKKFMPTFQTD
jgi:hypothetical protein